ncbi:MAG TPA: DUF2905 domain-containing protein [Bacteroidales bacterium]|nr:DUF2905 domain-containing protein [Bacteroidales bacterium]HOK73908.1 DUF2905 domain-containing protein [Bacteroidales bacterium]HOM39581.1 DUF2905 domain-containing protein [Bacteroidales bacterium]HOU29743.1 DUF2905 domain-containing protein [Bacteroidales bacterium]HPP91963.1 DUF2905 domain-containing protein [Bacteroidales bacterium]
MPQIGKFLVIAGIILIIIGLILWLGGSRLNWIGHLPGDIRIEKENVKFYFPVTTMIVISILLSFILWVIRKLF